MAEVLIKDGVLYRLWESMDETNEFEPMVIHHVKDIFGPSCEYFPKTQIEPIPHISKKREPDGFVVDFENKRWFILELKVLGDYAVNEIANQIADYKEINRRDQLNTIANSIKKHLREEKLRELVSDIILGKDPLVVAVINSLEGEKGEQFKLRARNADRLILFKTFARVASDGNFIKPQEVHCHLFEPCYESKTLVKHPTSLDYSSEVKIPQTPSRVARGSTTPDKDYRMPILSSLVEAGGKSRTKDVLKSVEEKLMGILTETDYEKLPSGRDIRWSNRAMWERLSMVEVGLLKPPSESGRGIWEITEKGRRYYEENK